MSIELYEKHVNKLRKNGSNHDLIKQIEDEYLQGVISQILYNQKKHNAGAPDFLKLLSIPATVAILAELPLDLFSIQVPFDGGSLFHFTKAGDPKSISTFVPDPFKVRSTISIKDLSGMADDMVISHLFNLTCTLCHEVIENTLRAMAEVNQTVMSLETSFDAEDAIAAMSEDIFNKIGRSANFIIMPPRFASAMRDQIKTYYDFDALPIDFRPIGVLRNRWKVYISNLVGQNKIVVGYRGSHPVDAGLVLSPISFFAYPKKMPNAYAINWCGYSEFIQYDYFRTISVKEDKSLEAIPNL